jgi:hypothetical protein
MVAFGLSACGDGSDRRLESDVGAAEDSGELVVPLAPGTEGTKPEVPLPSEEAGVPAGDGEMMTVRPEWPERIFSGLYSVELPNLEEPVHEDDLQKEFQVPTGSKNLAFEKPVTSSDEGPVIIGTLELVSDGEVHGADGYYVELGPGPQWVQIDLEGQAEIYTLLVWHYFKHDVAYKDVVIQISDDAEFEEFVTVYSNDHDDTLGFGKGEELTYIETRFGRIIELDEAIRGRYVRLHSNGNTSNELNHYTEVEVWGKSLD